MRILAAAVVVALALAAGAFAADPVNEIAPTSVCPNRGALLFCLHQFARKVNGVPPLTRNTRLYTAAKLKSDRIVQCGTFTHAPCGDNPFHVFAQAGFSCLACGENLALGYQGQRAAMKAWLASPGHRANILNPQLHEYGSNASHTLNGLRLWTVDLGTAP